MSSTETRILPDGKWSVDRVHSTVGFAVEYMAGTFTGTFSDFDVSVTDGVLKGSARVTGVGAGQGPEPRGAPSEP